MEPRKKASLGCLKALERVLVGSCSSRKQVGCVSPATPIPVLTSSQAFWALPGYTFKGIYKEIQKHMGSSVQNYIIASRTAQGFEEWKSSSEEERLDVVRRWNAVQLKLKGDKSKPGKDSAACPKVFLKRHLSSEDRKKYADEKKEKKTRKGAKRGSQNSWFSRSQSGLQQSRTDRGANETTQDHPELEEAIIRSVTATSRGNPEEDRVIERAIRASVAELQRASQEGNEDEALNRAIQASVTEAAQARGSASVIGSGRGTEAADNHDEVLGAALHRSVQDHHRHSEGEDSGIDTDDEEMREAIELSNQNTSSDAGPRGNTLEEDAELQKAIDESKQAHSLRAEDDARAKTEEEIVLEYVKKQSLAEQEHRRKHETKGKSREDYIGEDNDDDDMKRALEESLKINGKFGESSSGPA